MFGTLPLLVKILRVLLLGSGELGKEVAIECQRLRLKLTAVTTMQTHHDTIAHRSHVLDMLDGDALQASIIELEKTWLRGSWNRSYCHQQVSWARSTKFESSISTANATKLTMNREGIRRLAAEELKHLSAASRTPLEFLKPLLIRRYACIVKQ